MIHPAVSPPVSHTEAHAAIMSPLSKGDLFPSWQPTDFFLLFFFTASFHPHPGWWGHRRRCSGSRTVSPLTSGCLFEKCLTSPCGEPECICHFEIAAILTALFISFHFSTLLPSSHFLNARLGFTPSKRAVGMRWRSTQRESASTSVLN